MEDPLLIQPRFPDFDLKVSFEKKGEMGVEL